MNKLNETKFNFLIVFRIVLFMAFILHSLFLVFFYLTGIHILVIFNAISVFLYIYLVCTIKGKLIYASILTYIEVYLHSILCVYLFGWIGGFYVYPLCLIPTMYFISINMMKKGKYGHIIALISMATYLYMRVFNAIRTELPPFQDVIQRFDLFLYVFNSASAAIVFIMLICSFLYEIRYAQEELENKNKILINIANIDALTEINNRRCMNEIIKKEVEKFYDSKEPFCIAICDIDNFKKINDTYGHDCGDIVLKNIADILKDSKNKSDIEVSRWGGEEFLILLKNGIKQAKKECEIILNRIRDYSLDYQDKHIKVTMTIGIAEFNEENDNIENVLKIADNNLYKGKRTTKNCIIV